MSKVNPNPYAFSHFKHWIGKHGMSSGLGGGAWDYTLKDYSTNQAIDYNRLIQHAGKHGWRGKIEGGNKTYYPGDQRKQALRKRIK